ncbi:hypothetical protein DCAR_0934743 [Daucus carota subsp. sativus]|uniref:Uncharacterized protein n=1 Tax=Daucus carota subsp. sativus TaxID=79200 RepID=A0A175YGT8_DAUCS|nr:hypothetical protein DCAR_0934743 [Daucus carota subsp. sativus]
MKAAKEDFALMCKSMTDRQAEILTSGLFLEEQHRRVIDLLDGKQDVVGDSSTADDETARTSGNEDARKLAREADESLRNHRVYREIELQELEKIFKKYEGMLKQNMSEMRKSAEDIEIQRRELSPKLIQLARSKADESGTT